MTNQINPRVLIWARESAGLEIREAAEHLGFTPTEQAKSTLKSFESGESIPQREVLSRMARIYHRPLLVFYLLEPPQKGERGIDFRGNAATHSRRDNARLDALIRNLRARQSIISDTLRSLKDPITDVVGTHSMAEPIADLVDHLVSITRIDEAGHDGRARQGNIFGHIRSSLGSKGVFVIVEYGFPEDDEQMNTDLLRLATVADPQAPFILLNGNLGSGELAQAAGHGLAHLAYGQSGYCTFADSDIEQACRQVGSEIFDGYEVSSSEMPAMASLERKRFKAGNVLLRTLRTAIDAEELSWTRAGTVLNTNPLSVPGILGFRAS